MTGLPPVTGGATRIVLVRHGEPDESVRGRCYGRLDPSLSPAGREQMRRTWNVLSGMEIAAIYCSPSRRAIESAEQRPTDEPAVLLDDRLREIDFGDLEGQTYDDIASGCSSIHQMWMIDPTQVQFPGGEDFRAMQARVLAAFDDIRRANDRQTVIAVSHGGVNRTVLAAALHLHPRRLFAVDQAFASVSIIDYFGDEPLVRLVNGLPESC